MLNENKALVFLTQRHARVVSWYHPISCCCDYIVTMQLIVAVFGGALDNPRNAELVVPLLCGRRHGFLSKALSLLARRGMEQRQAAVVRLPGEMFATISRCAALQFRRRPLAELLQLLASMVVPLRMESSAAGSAGCVGPYAVALGEVFLCAAAFSQRKVMGDADPPLVTALCDLVTEVLAHLPMVMCSTVPRTKFHAATVQPVDPASASPPGSGRSMATHVAGGAQATLLEVIVVVLAKHLHVTDCEAAKVRRFGVSLCWDIDCTRAPPLCLHICPTRISRPEYLRVSN